MFTLIEEVTFDEARLEVPATGIAFALALIGLSPSAFATDYAVLPTVTVTGSYVSYWDPTSYSPSYVSTQNFFSGGMQIGSAILQAQARALDMANVCKSPVSSSAKSTTHTSDVTTRWLAAQELFNVVMAQGLWSMYRAATNSLSFIMNNSKYAGFRVTYADGYVETWAVYPGYSTSTIKLLDQPLPNSLKSGGGAGCTAG